MQEQPENFSSFLVEHVANGTHWSAFGYSLDLSPLHYWLLGYDFHVTLDMLMVGLAALLCLTVLITTAQRYRNDLPRGRFGHAIEAMVCFVRNDIVIPFVGHHDEHKWTPFALTLFFFILSMNILGLVPNLHTATGNISVTAPLAVIVFLVINISGILHQGALRYIKGLAPSGLSLPMLIFMYPIELISLVSKTATLAIRLFANMAAGHFLIFSLLGLMALMKSYAWGSFSVPLAVAMYGFEVFVALLQAYVFTLLSMLFIGSAIHPDH